MSAEFFKMLKEAGVHVMAVDVSPDGEVRIADAADMYEETDEHGNPKEPAPGFREGQRVRVLDSEPPAYGHILEICDCPFASALKSRCIEVKLHESCVEAVGFAESHYKEYQLEAID